jgi:glycosyltransferase involved in cell wall biosynthesis
MNEPKVTIFCVTYNQDKYIRQCLESFLNQKTNFKFEVLIADDCSTDLTPQIIKEYAQKYPEIIKPIFRDKNIGPGQNFVYGLQKVTGKYIAYCEGDDFFEDENKIQLQADFLDTNPKCSFCFHPVRVFFENKEEPDYIFPSNGKNKKYTLERLLKSNFIQSNAVMYRKMDYSNIPTNIQGTSA